MKNTIIFTDSLGSLQAISGRKLNKSLLLKNIVETIFEIQNKGVNIILAWIPSHTGIFHNEFVDNLAKNYDSNDIDIPRSQSYGNSNAHEALMLV